jgi:hypothetical protein
MHVLLSVLSFDAYKVTEWRSFLIKTGVMAGGHFVISLLVLTTHSSPSGGVATSVSHILGIVLGGCCRRC